MARTSGKRVSLTRPRRMNAAAWLSTAVLAVLAVLALGPAASRLGAVSAASSSSAVNAVPVVVPQHWENTNVNRVLDLSVSTVVRDSVTVTAKNTASAPESSYYLAVDAVAADQKLAVLDAVIKGEKTKLAVEKAQFDATRSVQFYKVTLPKAVAAGESVTLQISLSFVHVTENLPSKIGQTDRASRVFHGNSHFLSPYTTEKEKTTVKTPATKVHSHSPSAGSVSGNQYSYSSSDVAPFSSEDVRFHYECPSPLLAVEKLVRRIEVSHWTSKVEVSEDWILVHEGPTLKDPFNRIDFSKSNGYRMESSTVANTFTFVWPAGAIDAWYRDVDGNISTSHFRTEASRSVFEMRSRYPIYGGWKFSWMHGYEVPQSFKSKDGLVRVDSKTGKYVLKAKAYEGLKNLPIDKFVVEIVMPEGATDIKIDLPFIADGKEESISYSYFDTVGKPTYRFTKNRFVDEMSGDITVTYNFASTAYLRKPLVITTGIFIFLASVALLRRVDTSLEKDEATEAASSLKKLHKALESAFDDYNRRSRNADAFVSKRAPLLLDLASSEASLARSNSALADLWSQRRVKLVQQQDEVLALHKLNSADADKRRADISRKLDTLKAEIVALDTQLS